MTHHGDDKVDQRVKRLLQRFAQAKLAKSFTAWKDALAREPCERTSAEVSAVLGLLQKVPLFAQLASESQYCIAAHATLQVLSDGVEVPSSEGDTKRLFAVVSGNISLIHGDPSHSRLQQLLQATVQCCQEEMAVPSAVHEEAGAETAATCGMKTATGRDSSASGSRSTGVWQQVRQAASAGQKRLVHSGWQTRGQSPTGIPKTNSLLQQTLQLPKAGLGIGTNADALADCVSVQAVTTGATFCGHQFPATPPVTFTAAAGYSSEDAPQLSQLPNSCLAAVADPNTVAALLVVSKEAFMEAMRLQHEHHVSRLLDMACRLPCLRHTPIKELHKLAAHMQESTYEAGQLLLQQGKEVTDVHFLVSGTVQLTYTPPAAVQQQKSAAEATGIAAEHSDAAAAVCGTVAVYHAGSTSKQLVASLRAQAQQAPAVLGTRGPGWVLGDDAMRERRIAVSVAATTRVVTLKVAPQKLLCVLDPLTLRLFGRLRQQQPAAQQQLIQVALTETSQQLQQPPPQQQLRTVVLDQVYESAPRPMTILRPGDVGHQQLQDQEVVSQKPPWHSTRGHDHAASSSQNGAVGLGGAGRMCLGPGPAALTAAATSHAVDASPQTSHDAVAEELEGWAEGLPKGLTLDKCEGLPRSVSVVQLIGLISDIESSRRLEADSPPSRYSLEASSGNCTTMPVTSGGSTAGDLVHTELLESCGIAVLQIRVLPGQAPVSGPALAGALDDVAAAWAAVTYDESLQLVRWSATQWMMIGQLEPGASKRAGLEGLAGAVLSAAVRLSGVINRSTDILPVVGLAAGIASGSCFVQYEAGNFVSKVSGRAYDAAVDLCSEAATSSASALAHSHCSKDSSHSTVLVTDGVAAMLQSSFWLEPCGGSSLLVSARPLLQPPPGSRSGSPANPSQSSGRQTLGPGRNTIIGLGANLLNPTTPKTPGGGLLLPNWGKAQNERRQMRRKFEALQDLLAGGGDTLPPPPDHMLTQPPPVGGHKTPVGSMSGTGCFKAVGVNGGAVGSHGVTFSPAADSTGASGDSSASGTCSKKGFKPRLTISVDGGASPTGAGTAASLDEAATPGANTNCRTPGSKSPNRAGSKVHAAQEETTDSLLTPTLVMDSPWSQQQHHTAANGVGAGKPSVAALSAAQARLGGSRCSTPSSTGSRKQSQGGSGLGARQSIRQQVWQEVQELREGDRQVAPAPAGLTAAGCPFLPVGTPPTAADHLTGSVGGGNSSGSGAGSGHGARFAHSVTGLSTTVCLVADCTRPRSADVVTGVTADRVAGGRLKVMFMTPRKSGNRRTTVSTWGSSSGGKPCTSSSDGCLQQHRWSRKSLGQAHAVLQQKQKQVGIVCSNDGTVQSRSSSGSGSGQKDRGETGPAATVLASKHQLSRSSLGGNSCDPYGGGSMQSYHSQQQLQLEPACSDAESFNSMSLYPVNDAEVSSSWRGTAAATAAAQLEQLRHQAIVMSACKALGSYAAAKHYVAALPDGLMTVNLSTAGLSQLPPLTRLTQLEQLSASFNKLDSLPALKPANVAAVAAAAAAAGDTGGGSSDNDGTGSGHVLQKLTQQLLSGAASALPSTLTWLGLAHNRLEQLPLELPAALPHLTELDLSDNQLGTLPTTFGALSCLKLLFLYHNKLAALPGSFTRLYSLQTLNLSHNCLTQLPADLHQLPSLVSLQLQHNQLQQLPLELTNLSCLKSLELGYNNLSSLPQGLLLGLSGLTGLDLAGNGLTIWHLEMAVAAPAVAQAAEQQGVDAQQPVEQRTLSSVEAAASQVTTHNGAAAAASKQAPSPNSQLSAGTEVLPACEILPVLQVLGLSHNQLQRLPDWLPSSLKRLSASRNQLTELPAGLCCKLSGLTVLDLHDNQLTDVPKELMHLEHLQVLALSGNPGLDCEVVAAEQVESGARGAKKSDRAREAASKCERVGAGRGERSMSECTKGVAWAYKWMMQRKSAAAATILRGVQQQRQQKQQQVAGALLKGLLPGIRQTVIVESGRIL